MFHSEPYYSLPDTELLKKVGDFIKRTRLERNITQQGLAFKTGLDRSSISGIENGKGINFLSLIQILRALDKLELLAAFFEESAIQISPITMVKLQGKQRKYASSSRSPHKPKKEPEW